MASGRYTSRQLVELYLQRIDAIDRGGPALRSIGEVNPDALRIADDSTPSVASAVRVARCTGSRSSSKDNIDTGDRWRRPAGSLALDGSTAPRDAFVVERLRAAGAVILGKTNLSEWANFRLAALLERLECPRRPGEKSLCARIAIRAVRARAAAWPSRPISRRLRWAPRPMARWSARQRQRPRRIKPTIGLVSRAGIIPIAHSQDTAGPMARTVTDAAILLTAMSGRDPRDPATERAGSRALDYAANLDAEALKGARIGVSRAGHFGYSAGRGSPDRGRRRCDEGPRARWSSIRSRSRTSAGSMPARWKCCCMSSRPG
jgi:amidase